MTGPVVAWAGSGICVVALVVAAAAMARRSPCDNPGAEPVAALVVATMGGSGLSLLGTLAVPRWVDITVVTAVVGVLLALAWSGWTGLGWDGAGGVGSPRRSSRVGVR